MFLRSFLFFIFMIIISSICVFFLGKFIIPADVRGLYAVLSVDKDNDDKTVRRLLEEGNLSSGGIISESTQWVLLDEFDSVSIIPLDEFHKRILPFDPRNDGYAEKLSSFFVHDNLRRFFIPLTGTNSAVLEKQLKNLLGDISFSVTYYGIERPYKLYFILFAAASACAIILSLVKKQRGHFFSFLLLPVLTPLSFFAAAGIALSSLIFGFIFLLREPLGEFFYVARLSSANRKPPLFSRHIFEPYKSYLPVIIFFIFSICAIAYLYKIQPVFLILVITITFALYLFSLRALSNYGLSHKRFNPLHILRRRNIETDFSLYMLPFIAASITAIFISPGISGNLMSNDEISFQLDKSDYYSHLNYQLSFSLRQLDSLNSNYPDYSLDNDGLPDSTAQNTIEYSDPPEFPSFPLEHLLSFLSGVNSDNKMRPESYSIPFNNFYLFFMIIFLIPLLNRKLVRNNEKNCGLFSLKNNTRFIRTDINRKKHYNNIKVKFVS